MHEKVPQSLTDVGSGVTRGYRSARYSEVMVGAGVGSERGRWSAAGADSPELVLGACKGPDARVAGQVQQYLVVASPGPGGPLAYFGSVSADHGCGTCHRENCRIAVHLMPIHR
jgi:hypothetical protein